MTQQHPAQPIVDAMQPAAAQQPNQPAAQSKTIEAQLQIDHLPSVNNFDGDKVNQWRLTSLACGGGCRDFAAMDGKPIDLKYYYCHQIEIVRQESGEIINPIRCVLIDKGGNAYGFVSEYIARELDTIIEIFGPGPYTEPMSIIVKQVNTRKGNRIYTVSPA